MSSWYPFLDPHLTTYHSHLIGVRIRKVTELGTSTLQELHLNLLPGPRRRPYFETPQIQYDTFKIHNGTIRIRLRIPRQPRSSNKHSWWHFAIPPQHSFSPSPPPQGKHIVLLLYCTSPHSYIRFARLTCVVLQRLRSFLRTSFSEILQKILEETLLRAVQG